MHQRPITKYLPRLERLEAKQLLNGSSGSTSVLDQRSLADHLDEPQKPVNGREQQKGTTNQHASTSGASPLSVATKPTYGYLVYRITNPNQFNNHLTPPFSQVMVQTQQPVPGQVYNVLFVVVRNGTAQTFDASSGFRVKLPQDTASFPILTGSEQWRPGQQLVFYVLTKKYYPLPSQVHSGFQFELGQARSVAIPGPSGIFLRVKYDPITFARTLDSIVAFGAGNQGGIGAKFGLPNTAIYEFLSAKANRIDFGGYF